MMWLILVIFLPISLFSMQHEWAGYVNPGVLVDGIDERYEEFDAQLSYLVWQCVAAAPAPVVPAELTPSLLTSQTSVVPVVCDQPKQRTSKRVSVVISARRGVVGCKICGKRFSSKYKFSRHYHKYHSHISPFAWVAYGKLGIDLNEFLNKVRHRG